MKKFLLVVVTFFLAILSSWESKAQYNTLKFGEFGITSITPLGRGSVKGRVWIDVENPLPGFSVSNIEGKFYLDGRALLEGHVDDYYVPSGTNRITLTGTATMCPGATLLDILGLMLFDPEMSTVDIKAVVTDDGADPVVMEVRNMPLLKLLKKDGEENETNDESKNSK